MADYNHDVKVYIYDLSKGMARAMSQTFLGKQIDGIWHTGVVVHGKEFFFGGGGIEWCPPGGTIMGQPDTIKDLGQTQIPHDMFIEYLGELARSTYRANTYHLLEHNCNTFSSEIAQFLTSNDIPSHITGLPAEVLNTPFGQMIKPFIDAMSVQPSGGHTLFPQTTPTAPSSSQSQPSSQTSQPTTAPVPTASAATSSAVNDKLQPVVYQLDIQKREYWTKNEWKFATQEKTLLMVIQDYIETEDATWSLGRDHMTLLLRLVLDCNNQYQNGAVQIMAKLLCEPDVAQILLHDPNTDFQMIFDKFDKCLENVKDTILKALTNCCSHAEGAGLYVNEKHNKSSTNLLVTCLLGESVDQSRIAMALSYNLCQTKIPEEMEFELGSALLNCVDKDVDEVSAYYLLTAVLHFIESNQEVKGLSMVLGINLDIIRTKSQRVATICDRVAKYL